MRHEQRFSAEMAHELRTPLTGVRGEAELALRDRDLPADVRKVLERILRGTERMERVIETLLTVARSDAEPTRGSCDARAGVSRALDASRRRLSARASSWRSRRRPRRCEWAPTRTRSHRRCSRCSRTRSGTRRTA